MLAKSLADSNNLFFKSEVYLATSLSRAGYYIAVHSEC